jgi:mRNA-degrading endonuclease RelE of RelBE toxin-antitoxin system
VENPCQRALEITLRVGDWRVIIELDVAARAIIIQRILPRGRAYDR